MKRAPASIAAQMVAQRIPLPAYGYRINPSLPVTVLRPVVAWSYDVKGKK